MSDANIRKLYSLYFCEWILDSGETNLLSLGEAFDERISDILSFKALAAKEVRKMSDESLAKLVGNSTETMDDAAQAVNLENDRKFRDLSKVAPSALCAKVSSAHNAGFCCTNTQWLLWTARDIALAQFPMELLVTANQIAPLKYLDDFHRINGKLNIRLGC